MIIYNSGTTPGSRNGPESRKEERFLSFLKWRIDRVFTLLAWNARLSGQCTFTGLNVAGLNVAGLNVGYPLITPDTSVNFYWFLYWLMWIFGNFFLLLSSDLCVTRLLVSLQSSSFFPLSSSTAHILFIVNLMRQLSSWSKIYRTAMLGCYTFHPKKREKFIYNFYWYYMPN